MTIRGTALFIEYLTRELDLNKSDMPELGHWGRMGSTIGSLCLKLNLLDMDKINNVLEIQEQAGGLFGDVAIELGYLNAEEVEKLLNVQKWCRREEILHRLLLTNTINKDQYHRFAPKVYLFQELTDCSLNLCKSLHIATAHSRISYFIFVKFFLV